MERFLNPGKSNRRAGRLDEFLLQAQPLLFEDTKIDQGPEFSKFDYIFSDMRSIIETYKLDDYYEEMFKYMSIFNHLRTGESSPEEFDIFYYNCQTLLMEILNDAAVIDQNNSANEAMGVPPGRITPPNKRGHADDHQVASDIVSDEGLHEYLNTKENFYNRKFVDLVADGERGGVHLKFYSAITDYIHIIRELSMPGKDVKLFRKLTIELRNYMSNSKKRPVEEILLTIENFKVKLNGNLKK